MRSFLLPSLVSLLVASCASSAQPVASVSAAELPSAGELAWIVGAWTSCGETTVHEDWTQRGTSFHGRGTTRSATAVTGERMRIAVQDGNWVYVATPEGREPVTFTLSRWSGSSATFINPTHDYPQRIAYERHGDTLRARIDKLDATDASSWQYELGRGCQP